MLECISTQNPSAKARKVQEVAPGKQVVVSFTLASQLRFRETADTLVDTAQNLEWTKQDNGGDIDWQGAMAWCNQKGGNWRLPTAAELKRLFDRSGSSTTPCGEGTCKVSPQFRLSKWWFWSSERNGSSEAWSVNLYGGYRYSDHIGRRSNGRALCVRRP